jgi:hypothetical protein
MKKLIFPTMSKIAKFGKKTQGILGVNCFWNPKIIMEVGSRQPHLD